MTQFLIGHRGAMGLAPENTLKSFGIACEKGADILECDVRMSKDGHLVVIHDALVNRTTNGKGPVRRHSLEKLKSLDAGDGEKIPTLLEVVELAKKYDKKVIVEIKARTRISAVQTAKAVSAFIEEHNVSDRIIVYSFWKIAIKTVKEMIPAVPAAVLYARLLRSKKQMIRHLKSIGADGVSIAYKHITEEMVTLMKEHRLFLDAWVVNDATSFEYMQEIGVRGLITDYPGSLQ